MGHAYGRLGPWVVACSLATVSACERDVGATTAPRADRVAEPVAEPIVVEPARDPPAAGPVFDAQELAAHIHDVYTYPPTACRLRELLGTEGLARLREHGGYYPNELDEGGEGLSYYGRVCPQPGCGSALTWVGPEGELIVAWLSADVGGTAQIVTAASSAEPSEALPLAVERFVAEASARERIEVALAASECAGPELEARRQRFVASAEHRACDAEFSRVWTPAAVVPVDGERAPFFAAPDEGSRREAYVVAGDLVELGWAHADDPAYVCAEFVSLAGRRTTGWLRVDALVELPDFGSPPSRAELDALVVGPTPAWLDLGSPAVRLGELSIRRSAKDRVEVALERVMAGHLCTLRGGLELAGPRVLVDQGTGCGAAGVVFNNGVYLWEDGGCSGARATCTGGYAPNARESLSSP